MKDRLIRALESDDSGDLDLIIRERDPAYFKELLALLDPDAEVKEGYRAKTLYALAKWQPEEAVPYILKVLPQLDEKERIQAIQALGKAKTQKALDEIVKHIRDKSPYVRKFVIKALAQYEQSLAKEKIQEMKEQDPEDFVRETAAKEQKAGRK